MSYSVIATALFEKSIKRLIKKYPSLKEDIEILIRSLPEKPLQGNPLGKNCFKIRVAIASKGKGKSGGARVITFIRVAYENVFLVDIYDKSEQSTISEKQLENIIRQLTNK